MNSELGGQDGNLGGCRPAIPAELTREVVSGYRGAVEAISASGLRGWVLNAADVGETLAVDVLLDGEEIASAYAGVPRVDLSRILQRPVCAGFLIEWSKARLPPSAQARAADDKADLEFLLRGTGFGLPVLVPPPSIGELRAWIGEGGNPPPLSGSEQNARIQAYAGQQVAPLAPGDEEVKLIAFYLPQYHPIPENDKWWGPGFTEWSNVTRARPLFPGHHQPREPADLGYYDLRLPEVREAQARLAREHGVYGFCYYYYWFAGRRILERPLQEVLESGQPDFPFCICWANENWTRSWDGSDNDVLLRQEHSLENEAAFIRDAIPLLKDPRYIRVRGAALLLVYRVELLKEPARTAETWRSICREEGVGEIYLAGVESFGFADPQAAGFDASVEFPPLTEPPTPITAKVEGLDPAFSGEVFDYEEVVGREINRPPPLHRRFRGIMCGWDNTPRRKERIYIFAKANPANYECWLRGLVDYTRENLPPGERLIFVNAWNEWAEGNYLEPDKKHGRGYLEATRRALDGGQEWRELVAYARKKQALSGAALAALIDDFERRFIHYERSLGFMAKLHRGGFPLLAAKTVFLADAPISAIPMEAAGGHGFLDQVNAHRWQGHAVVQRDRFVRLGGWVTATGSVAMEDTHSYLVLERAGDGKRFYGLVFGRRRRNDVLGAFPGLPPQEIEFSGFTVYADIGRVEPGEYALGMTLEAGERLLLHFFAGSLTVV